MDQNGVPIVVHGADTQTAGRLNVLRWDRRARMQRSVKFFGVSLAATILAVFIPGLHFILVPVGVLVTIFGPFMIYGRTSKIEGGTATCPYCGKEFPIAARPERYPFDDLCTSCHRHVTVRVAAGSQS